MITIELQKGFLSLYPDTQLSFQLQNPAYLRDKPDFGTGLIFGFKVPLDPNNLRHLEHPNQLGSLRAWVTDAKCLVAHFGIPVFNGYLTVKQTSLFDREQWAEVSIAVHPLASLKDTPIANLDMGTLPSAQQDIIDACNRSLGNTGTYTCFPVYNPAYKEIKENNPGVETQYFQNAWDGNGINFRPDNGFGDLYLNIVNLTPHLRVSYILEKIFQSVDYKLENRFQNNRELQSLHQIGFGNAAHFQQDVNASGNDLPNLVPNFPLNRALTNTTCAEWVGRLCRLFAVAPYPNEITQTIELESFADVLAKPPAQDWTQYVVRGGNMDTAFGIDFKLSLPKPFMLPELKDLKRFDLGFGGVSANAEKGIYVRGDYPDPTLFFHDDAPIPVGMWKNPDWMVQESYQTVFGNGKNSLDAGFIASPNIRYDLQGNLMKHPFTRNTKYPFAACAAHQKGLQSQEAMSDFDGKDWLVLYRGLQHLNDFSFPLATSEANQVFGGNNEYSLQFVGDKCIQNHFWAWAKTFKGLPVKVKLSLPMDKFLRFMFNQKIIINGFHFLAQSFQGVLRHKVRRVECEVVLIQV